MIKKRISNQSRLKAQFEGFVKTPPLWEEAAFGIQQFPISAPLPHLLNQTVIPPPSHGPLGKRMESFFQFYVEHFSDYRTLAHNVQIQGTSATVGEIDFLLEENSTAQVLHVELVYKFYLYEPSIQDELSKWIGPNRRDTLVKKLDRLQRHQLPMVYDTASRPLMEELGVSVDTVKQYVCFKSQLFLPKNFGATVPLINPSCLMGFWIRYENFTAGEYGEFSFFSPSKQDWPMDPSQNDQWYDFTATRLQVHDFIIHKRSPLLWINKGYGVFERLFVVWW